MDLAATALEELCRSHGAHTVVLYGSLARGDATAESDVDVAAFADVDVGVRDARPWRGTFLDAFVYPTARLETVDAELLKLLGGKILLDARGLAAPFFARLEAFDRAGPPKLAADEIHARRIWAHKMLARIARGDVEANYRRHWLLYQLLEDHFGYQDRWYRGPKEALAALRRTEPETFAAFERALAPGASDEDLAALVRCVVGDA